MYKQYGFTLFGVNNYFNLTEEPLFENIVLFEGGTVYNNEWEEGQIIPPINKETLINQIMEDNGDLLCYRQIPVQFKINVNQFFNSYYQNFKMIWIALNMNYNPIDNYDRHEYILDEYNSSNKRTDSTHYKNTDDINYLGSETNTNKPTGSETHELKQTGNTITTNRISADNSNDWSKDTQAEVEPPTKTEDKLSFTQRQTEDKKEFTNRWNKEAFEHIYLDGNDLMEHLGDDTKKIWAHGNIGVEKTSSIIKAEIEMRQFNFYEMVSKLFSKKLLLEIY